jgi:hypothetical protein
VIEWHNGGRTKSLETPTGPGEEPTMKTVSKLQANQGTLERSWCIW